jgi:histidinol dehydrogenase
MRIIEGIEKARPLFSRQGGPGAKVDEALEKSVRQIVDGVSQQGDKALFEFTQKFDGVNLASLQVGQDAIERAYRLTDKSLIEAMETAAEQITAYHQKQRKQLVKDNKSSRLGWVMRPLNKIGVYVPGGLAPLPSSLLMVVIPARVAGVKEIIVATPPQKNGQISPVTLAAARIARVDRVFSLGGAQAIAALAYGTESVPAVDKVCGPGNIYVTLAKKMVYGTVGIDGLYGPSEVVIIADETANPIYIAADLLAQAEHGSMASAIMITTSKKMAGDVNDELEKQLKDLSRREITAEGLEKRGAIAIVDTIEEAIELGNLYAPEHLCLAVKNAKAYINKVSNAGCLFVGEDALEALVDYAAGPSHVLPTEGTARFGSGLNILDFIKLTSVVKTGKKDIERLGKAAITIARAEGLDAHARAVEKRLDNAAQGGN